MRFCKRKGALLLNSIKLRTIHNIKSALKCFIPATYTKAEKIKVEIDQQYDMLNKQLSRCINTIDLVHAKVDKEIPIIEKARREGAESVWAAVFHDTITASDWLKEKKFSPGRWALGYPALYILYRVLNDRKPTSILELGLGQSTRMIAQYAAANPQIRHVVVEADPLWIDCFSQDYSLPKNTVIKQMNYEMESWNGYDVRVYKGFQDSFAEEKFSFFVIDAPTGGDLEKYSRIDILKVMPNILNNDFIILIDDFNRRTEKNTVELVEKCLEEHGIEYNRGTYSGEKDSILICAKHLQFLTSM